MRENYIFIYLDKEIENVKRKVERMEYRVERFNMYLIRMIEE